MKGIISAAVHALIAVIVLYILASVFMDVNIFANSFFTALAFIVMFSWMYFEVLTLRL